MRKSIPVFTIAFIALMAALPVQSAGSSPLIHASAARAFGVRVHVATPFGDPSLTIEPTPFASAADPSVDVVTRSVLGPLRAPEDGTLVGDARALVAEAARTLTPKPASQAEAVVSNVSLFETAGVPLISADVIHAASSTECTSASSAKTSAAGSRLVGLSIAGEIIDETPEPNTEIPLVYDNGTPADASDDLAVRVILNEQTPAAHGYGLIVTMIHAIVSTPADAGRIFADIRIAEAFSTAFCGQGGTPRPVRVIDFDKVVTHTDSDPKGALDDGIATAHRGETVTWTVTLKNTSDTGCMLSTVHDSLPPHFGFVRTAGAFDGVEPSLAEQDVVWEPEDQMQLDPGETITQTITTRVASDAPFGTYTNLFGVFESSCSQASSGLMGPVTIVPKTTTTVLSKPKATPTQAPLAATGVPLAPLAAASVALLMAAHLTRVLRTTRNEIE